MSLENKELGHYSYFFLPFHLVAIFNNSLYNAVGNNDRRKCSMELGDTIKFKKDELPVGFMSSIRERLKSAKVPFIVASTVATMGFYGLMDQYSVNLPDNLYTIAEAAPSKKFAEIQKYNERRDYLVEKLSEIKQEINKGKEEETIKNMIEKYTDLLNEDMDSSRKKDIQYAKTVLERYKPDRKVVFYNESQLEQAQTLTRMSVVDFAQGQRWAELGPKFYMTIVDPYINKEDKVASVKIPKMNDNIVTFRIPTKFANPRNRAEDLPENKMVYDHAMQFLYKFFENEIDKEQLDEVIQQTIDLGKDDNTALKILSEARQFPVGSKERRAINIKTEIAANYPKAQIKKKFNGKQYIFKYNNLDGTVIIEFPMD